MPQKSQPMGLVGSREAISAPTIGNASESNPVSTAKPGPGLSPGTPAGITSPVRKSSKRASAMSATHSAHSDQANHAAVRWLIQLTPRPSSLVPSITIPLYRTTVSQALRLTLRGDIPREYLPAPPTTRTWWSRGCGGAGHKSLTILSIGGEYTSDTLSEPREWLLRASPFW